uniref:Immunoglobulin-like domain-containing receptor 2 n=1 Tax=Poecilia reticulata TaxID=8081 RepID=A0A3P9Q523_POERE
MLYSVVLPCQYTSVSTQPAMVKWIYKSYCRDRTRDSFSFPDSLGVGGGYDAGSTASHLDCSDNRRTVRTVASISGSSVTLSEYYKNRDVTIINTADLRIGEVQWGDSGVYFCQVTIADDIEGQNEASVELLQNQVLILNVLFLLLVGVCWCQCCPHSCCCYVSCWCCPDTCCCPRHLYEAGKGIKTGASTPQTPAYPPYFVSGLPAMIPIAPPSLVDKVSTVAPSDGTLVAAACNQSELSSLHEGDTNFHQTFRNVQKKALPAIPDQDSGPEPHGYHENRSPDLHDEDKHDRWNPRSEHLQRKTYHSSGRTVSLDELEEFATTYKKRGGRGAERREEEMVEYEMEVLEYGGYPSHRKGPPQHYYSNGDELDDNSEHEGHTRPPPPKMDPPSTSSQERDYDATFLNSLLERKAKLRGISQGRNGAQAEEDLDWPSIRSGKKTSRESSRLCSRSPSNRPEADSLSPSDSERARTERPSPRSLQANTHSPSPLHSLPAHREEHRDRSRKVSTLLSRDSLIV